MTGSAGADERGASAVEYSLLVVAIAALIVAVVFTLGTFVAGHFDDTCASLDAGEFSGSTTCP